MANPPLIPVEALSEKPVRPDLIGKWVANMTLPKNTPTIDATVQATARTEELLEERVRLLDGLSEAMDAARLAMVSFDVETLEKRIAEQERLCTIIRLIEEEANSLQDGATIPSATHSPDSPAMLAFARERSLHVAISSVRDAEANVKARNELQASLACRSRTTVAALVDTKEQAANLIRLQNAYQASAQITAVIAKLLASTRATSA
jgi:hypothetical protein